MNNPEITESEFLDSPDAALSWAQLDMRYAPSSLEIMDYVIAQAAKGDARASELMSRIAKSYAYYNFAPLEEDAH